MPRTPHQPPVAVLLTAEKYQRPKDIKRKNVIVTGLGSSNSKPHFTVAICLFRDELKYYCYKWLDQTRHGKSCLLLRVALSSSEQVLETLNHAKLQRLSNDSVVSKSVFINPDPTPVERQAPFETRCGPGSSIAVLCSPVNVPHRARTITAISASRQFREKRSRSI